MSLHGEKLLHLVKCVMMKVMERSQSFSLQTVYRQSVLRQTQTHHTAVISTQNTESFKKLITSNFYHIFHQRLQRLNGFCHVCLETSAGIVQVLLFCLTFLFSNRFSSINITAGSFVYDCVNSLLIY